MSILFAGGEDIDFPFGTVVPVTTGAGNFRAGFARCAVGGNDYSGGMIKSCSFVGGNITNGWLSWRGPFWNNGASPCALIGFGNLGSHNAIGLSLNASSQPIFCKWDAPTFSTLGSAFTSIAFNNTAINKFDLQLINYGTSGTLNLYVNGVFIGSFIGNLTVAGTTGFSSVFIGAFGRFQQLWSSEIIAANESTLALQGVVSLAGNSNGTVQQWTNPDYTKSNEITTDDTNSNYSNTAAQDNQIGLLTVPTGPYLVKAVRIAARALATGGGFTTGVRLGLKNPGGTIGMGAVNTLSTSYSTVDQAFPTDPTSGLAWGADLTGYQLDMRSV